VASSLLDSPIIHGWKSGLISVIKATGQMAARLACAGRERSAATAGPDLGEVHSHFAAKPMFARWHPAMLDDYVRHGTEPDPADRSGAARRLKFRPEIEAEIYSTVPHRLVPYLRPASAGRADRLHRRHALARGTARPASRATERLTQGRISWIEGSHLFPFETARGKTTDAVLDWIARLDRGTLRPESLPSPDSLPCIFSPRLVLLLILPPLLWAATPCSPGWRSTASARCGSTRCAGAWRC
jgi:hypothetical protein